MEHSFDIKVAKTYGVIEAILIKNFQFWIIKNKANRKHSYRIDDSSEETRTWTYNSVESLKELFPYLTANQIRYALNNLINKKVLLKGSFNKNKYDRTLWYCFYDEKKWLADFDTKAQPDNSPTTHPTQTEDTLYSPFGQEEEENEEKEKEKEKTIPTFQEFFDYCKTLPPYNPSLDFALEAKYNAWVANGWKDGHNKKIKNWKTKIQNTIIYLKGTTYGNNRQLRKGDIDFDKYKRELATERPIS